MRGLDKTIREFVLNVKRTDEIKLLEFFRIFGKGKFLIFGSILLFLFLGGLRSYTSPKEYTVSSQVLTEQQINPAYGSLGNLVGIASGMSNKSLISDNTISPTLYPLIVQNSNFLLTLVSESYHFQDLGKTVKLVDYFNLYEKRNVFDMMILYPINWLKRLAKPKSDSDVENISNTLTSADGDSISYLIISKEELKAINSIRNRIEITQKDQILTVSTKMPDPTVSTILNTKIIDHLINYITSYQTDKERINKEFIESQLKKAIKNYKEKQNALAAFEDSNRGLIFEADKNIEKRLSTEFNMAASVYTTLSQQLEQSKIKLQESRPILTVIEQPAVPLEPSEPNLLLSLVIFGLLGTFLGFLVILSKIIFAFIRTPNDQ